MNQSWISVTPLRPNITLSSGRTVSHSYMDNGAQRVTPTTGDHFLTDAEWDEYCALLRAS